MAATCVECQSAIAIKPKPISSDLRKKSEMRQSAGMESEKVMVRNMNHLKQTRTLVFVTVLTVVMFCIPGIADDKPRGVIQCSNLIYGKNKSSVCYSPGFLKQIQRDSNIKTSAKFTPVKVESAEMYQYPFAVMTGEGAFSLVEQQRTSLRNYLLNGGFVVASAGCSSSSWAKSFRKEIDKIFPDTQLREIDFSHPIFHSVYDIDKLDRTKSSGQAKLEGLEVDGKIVLIFSSDGLNDTSDAGGNCCCCGGNEIRNARQINVNLLAYTLTH